MVVLQARQQYNGNSTPYSQLPKTNFIFNIDLKKKGVREEIHGQYMAIYGQYIGNILAMHGQYTWAIYMGNTLGSTWAIHWHYMDNMRVI